MLPRGSPRFAISPARSTGEYIFKASTNWLIVFAIFSNLGLAMFSPAALGLLSDSVPLHRQSTAMGIYRGVCKNTGIIAGSALGGFVWGAWGPRLTFLMGSVAAGLGAIIIQFSKRQGLQESVAFDILGGYIRAKRLGLTFSLNAGLYSFRSDMRLDCVSNLPKSIG
ncbi:MFS transporter [Chloroflexota bacterium]